MSPIDDTPEPIAEQHVQPHAAGIEEIPGVINPWRPTGETPDQAAALLASVLESDDATRAADASAALRTLAGALASTHAATAQLAARDAPWGLKDVREPLRFIEAARPSRVALGVSSPGSARIVRETGGSTARRVAFASGVACGTLTIGCLLVVLAAFRVTLEPNPYIALAIALGGVVLVVTTAIALRESESK